MAAPFLSVVVPAYNEEARLPSVLGAIHRTVEARADDWSLEVLVVDDGSTDATVDVASSWTGRLPGLRVVRNPRNLGKGATICHGMAEAAGAWRLFTDADNSTDFAQVDDLLAAVERTGADVAFGSRAIAGARLAVRQPLRREVMGRLFNLAVQALVLPGIRDTQCGFKLFSAEAADAVFPRLVQRGFSFDVEALFVARRLGFQLVEVPIVWRDDANSRVSPLRDGLRMVRDLLVIRRTHRDLGPDWKSHPHATEEFPEVASPDTAPPPPAPPASD